MMCGFCCIALFGVLYAILVHTLNHFLPKIMARYVWLEVVGGVALTIGCLWLFVGDSVRPWQAVVAFALTGGPMVAGSLARQLLADFLTEKTEEGEVSEALDG